MKLINKDTLVAEIKKLKKSHDNWSCLGKCFHKEYENLLSFINTLEVKEIDLEKELKILDNTLFDLDGVAIKGATCYLTVEDVKARAGWDSIPAVVNDRIYIIDDNMYSRPAPRIADVVLDLSELLAK